MFNFKVTSVTAVTNSLLTNNYITLLTHSGVMIAFAVRTNLAVLGK